MKPSVLPRFFIHSPCGKGSDKGASTVSSKTSWQSYPLQCKTAKPVCVQRWCPWSTWKCRNSEHRDHLNYKTADCWFTPQHWKNITQNVVYMSVTGIWVASCFSLISSFVSFLLCDLFNFFDFVIFVTTTFDKFQLDRQLRLSQINVLALIRLKVQLYAVFIKLVSRMKFLFVGRKLIANYWDIPSETSRNCHKRLAPKTSSYDYWETFVRISLRDRLVCLADFVGMRLLAVLFLLPLPNFSLNVCLPTLLAAVWKCFLPLTRSAISGEAKCNKSASTHFAAETIYSRKSGIAVVPITCASALNPRLRCRPLPL